LTLAPFEPPPPSVYEQGVSVALAPQLHRLRPQAKTADFVLARRKIAFNEAYEVLLLDGEGRLLEGSSSNFYAASDGAVLTAGDGVLEGVTRSIILQLVEEAGIALHLRAPRLSDTAQLDEAFLSSSSRGLVPVRQIAAQVIGSGAPGPLTRQLMADYDRFVAQAIRTAVPAP
jgi:branched-subunit amino acid aminotransferase/4-amino-4-deoxychorismate lyase